MTTASRRAVDEIRRNVRRDDLYATLAHEEDEVEATDLSQVVDRVEDDVLRLMFMCCHPALTVEARTALTLRLVAGLTTREIARAFLTSEATVAQRIVRAKKTLATSGAALEEPGGPERSERLESVLAVVYLLFNEGYSATKGDDWTRPALCDEALRLGRIVSALAPRDAEVHGLVALMELQASRLGARVAPDGTPVLLLDQDRTRWSPWHLRRGLAALDAAERLADVPGAYLLQASIAACHARASEPERTEWARIAALYEQLVRLTGSAVAELNRAVALGMAHGPQTGLDIVDRIADLPALRGYHLVASVRGDLLRRLGRLDEAAVEMERAAAMTENGQERTLLLKRAASARGDGLAHDL